MNSVINYNANVVAYHHFTKNHWYTLHSSVDSVRT